MLELPFIELKITFIKRIKALFMGVINALECASQQIWMTFQTCICLLLMRYTYFGMNALKLQRKYKHVLKVCLD